jgi:Patatin-like phospholipase
LLCAGILAGNGCRTVEREPVPSALTRQAQLPGLPGVRLVMDPFSMELGQVDAFMGPGVANASKKSGPLHLLALSGGGAYGAYGAGVLCGWTRAGTRPEFDVVAGISTGSLIAPYAFLRAAYDERLKKAYTMTTDKDIFKKRSKFRILTGADAMADTAPLYQTLLKQFDEATLAAIAAEHRKGRRLYAGSTDLNAQELICWDLGAIAASGHPRARELFCRVLLASASIPGAFPPQYFEVEADGRRFYEMHGDGGVTTQVFGFIFLSRLMTLTGRSEGRMFVLRDELVTPAWAKVKPTVLHLAGRAIDSLVKYQGVGDIYRAYLVSVETGVDFNLAYIPSSFHRELPKGEAFDPAFMTALFNTGYDQARSGTAWKKEPPALQLIKPGHITSK